MRLYQFYLYISDIKCVSCTHMNIMFNGSVVHDCFFVLLLIILFDFAFIVQVIKINGVSMFHISLSLSLPLHPLPPLPAFKGPVLAWEWRGVVLRISISIKQCGEQESTENWSPNVNLKRKLKH